MGRHSLITKDRVLKSLGLFDCMAKHQYEELYFGEIRRSKALEKLLPELEKEGSITTVRHKQAKVYFLPRKNKTQIASIEHALACTEILIRLWRCRMEESEIMPERVFRGHDVVPDGGLRFSETRGTMLLFEFSTEKNFNHGGVVKGKITRYGKNLPSIEAYAQRDATVLFVIDADRQRIREFIRQMKPVLDEALNSGFSGEARYPFFFTDYETFKTIPIGKALKARAYFWHDGKEWALSNHD